MSHADFVHLRVHTAYSLAEGGLRLVEPKGKSGQKKPREDLLHLALAQNMPAFAFTDRNNLFGAQEVAIYAPPLGLQPILGAEVSVCWDTASLTFNRKPTLDRLVLLVQNEEGYQNLCALVSAAFLATDRIEPFVTRDEVEAYAGGLIALSAGIDGTLGRLLLEGQKDAAAAFVDALAALYPGRFYIEIDRHLSGDIGEKERRIEPDLLALAYAKNLPLVATNDVYFGERKQYEAHDALLCIAEKTMIDVADRRRLTPEHYFKSAAEMRTLFADLPEACDNTLAIAKRCAYMPPMRKPILPVFSSDAGRDEAAELRAQAEEGLRVRLRTNNITDEAPYWERLNYELDIITSMKFPGYFLIVSDFIKWAKSQDIPVGPGRGSGAGSLVAWALLITDLNPLRFNLLFERFLNPERISMPDFDVDFCQGRREEVIGYVQRRYGKDCVAQIITFGQLQARAVLRDVGRVLGMPYGYVDKISKLVPSNPANPISLPEALEMEPQLQQMRAEDPTVDKMMEIALQLEGLYRNASTHAAGVVIGNRRLVELVPLYRDPASPWPATQFNMKVVELAGLVKFDFLGLKTLDVLQQTVDFVREEGTEIDLSLIPLDDKPTYDLLTKGDTTGVFQLESSGMRDILRKLKPNRFEEIVALVALYRPGPMDNIPKYIACKNGEEEIDCLHPLLEPVLKDTFGIMIYQEQVMQAAQRLAGYSLGGADLLRRAMGKKKPEEMAAQRATFIAGAAKNGLDAAQASRIFDQIDKFAGYGFNKSHAAAYAVVTYRTAWLKTHHPVAFFAASMNYEMGDTDKLNVFRQELARHGIALLPPDINHSGVIFLPEKQKNGKLAIRYALAAMKGVGDQAMQDVVKAREAGGPFKDLVDLVERVDVRAVNRKQLEGLAMGGAFDSLMKNRAQVIASIDVLLKHGHTVADERASGQMNIFGGGASARPVLPKVKAWDELTRLQHEFSALGFYLSAHPLDNYRALLKRMNVVAFTEIGAKQRAGGPSRFKIAGIVLGRQEKTAKSGNRFAFVSASDTTGAFEVTVFSELLNARRDILEPGEALLMEVDAQGTGADLRFIGRNFERLSDVAARSAQGINIRLYEPDDVAAIKKRLDASTPGRGKVTLTLDLDDDVADVELPGGWQLSDQLKQDLRQIGNGLDVQEC
jgi:DNA polymerase-3 subunit alpha